jgi:hypothetical protein
LLFVVEGANIQKVTKLYALATRKVPDRAARGDSRRAKQNARLKYCDPARSRGEGPSRTLKRVVLKYIGIELFHQQAPYSRNRNAQNDFSKVELLR